MPAAADERRTGRCACGAVSYEIRGPVRPVSFCHCESCRRQSSHYVAATAAPVANITISGSGNLTDWRATPHAVRQFCKTCGSLMFWRWDGSGQISVMAGSLDLPSGLEPEMHIYIAEKGDYYEIADGLPQYETRADDDPFFD